MEPAIVINELRRTFGKVEAVAGLSLEVQKGEFFALLGPNGAGKSTTLHMLTTILRPTSGTATVMGYDVVRQAALVRRQLGMVFQDPALDDRLTARENLRIHAVLYGLPRSTWKAAVEHALEWGELSDVGDRRVRLYSGGMKRRLELARALMHHPHLLCLDEPTIGLDPQGRHHLWERIADLRTHGMTVLMTTHNLNEAEACDRVGIIDGGKLIAMGEPRALAAENGAADLEDLFLKLTGKKLRDEQATGRERLIAFAKKGGENTR